MTQEILEKPQATIISHTIILKSCLTLFNKIFCIYQEVILKGYFSSKKNYSFLKLKKLLKITDVAKS